MKEILIKTLKAYQEAVDKAKEFNDWEEYEFYLIRNDLEDGICFYISVRYEEYEDEFGDILKKYMTNTYDTYCDTPSQLDSIEDCIEKALKPRIELLTKMINDYESIN